MRLFLAAFLITAGALPLVPQIMVIMGLPPSGVEPPTDGLVAHYDFSDGSGTTLSDVSGNDFDGTIVGDPSWTTLDGENVLDFDGSGDYVTLPAGVYDGIKGDSTWSACIWAEAADSTANSTLLSFAVNTSSAFLWAFYGYDTNSGDGVRKWFNGATLENENDTEHADGTLKLFCSVEHSNVSHELFVDDVSRDTSTTDKTVASNLLGGTIAARAFNFDQEHTGAMSRVLVYDKDLSAAELTQVFDAGP